MLHFAWFFVYLVGAFLLMLCKWKFLHVFLPFHWNKNKSLLRFFYLYKTWICFWYCKHSILKTALFLFK